MLNVMIGKRSNLSQNLASVIDDSILVSSRLIVQELSNISWSKHSQINLIFNQFQPASQLNDLNSPVNYINNAISSTASVLEFVKSNNISLGKVIYTSSSSVYGNNESCSEDDTPIPASLHATLKAANEKLVMKFCQDMDFDYTIARIFNMYGGGDVFSIISKIILSYQNDENLTLVNNGESIRDFIHIDDVVSAYQKILTVQNLPIINIASGKGKSVASILDCLQENKVILKTSNIALSEIHISTADNSKLLSILGDYQFKDVGEYVLECIKS